MTTTKTTPSEPTGTPPTELDKYKQLNAELWLLIRNQSKMISYLENALYYVANKDKDTS